MSMVITEAQIRRAIPSVNNARLKEFVKVFNEWSDRFGINTPIRFTHFFAQVCCESGALAKTEENLNYSAEGLMKTWPSRFTREKALQYAHKPQAIANYVYANRMGNGSEASGDGWKYKGRGFIGLTGKDMYRAYRTSGFCNGDLMSHPEWLAGSPGNAKSAMWFWWKHRLSDIADLDNGINSNDICRQITKKVNGGYLGLSNRQYYMRKLKAEFGIKRT